MPGKTLMTSKDKQARRMVLHRMPIAKLRTLYANESGRLEFEVRNMLQGLDDDGRQLLVDAIIRIEGGEK